MVHTEANTTAGAMAHGTIRVMIVDDHQVVRRGLEACLETFDDIQLVAQATDGAQAVDICTDAHPDVILMDIRMPQMNGIEATRTILGKHRDVRVIALTSYKDRENVHGMVEAGASGYLLKDTPIDDLAHIIRGVREGRTTFCSEVTETLFKTPREVEKGQVRYDLSDRDKQLLAYLVDGCNNAQIADAMSVSRSTVKYYLRSLFNKLNVGTRLEAATIAIQERLIEIN